MSTYIPATGPANLIPPGFAGEDEHRLRSATTTVVEDDPKLGLSYVLGVFGSTTLTAIHPDSHQISGCYLDENSRASATVWAQDKNQAGYNLYFAANRPKPGLAKKASKQDIHSITAVYGDIDAKDGRTMEEALSAVLRIQPAPSLIIMSGGGYQPIWMLRKPLLVTPENIRRAEGIGRRIAAEAGGDAVQNIDRILRVPFTRNFPDAKKRAAGREVCLSGIVVMGDQH